MQIKLNYTDKELTTLLDGLNNALLAVDKIYAALKFDCEVPSVFSEFNEKTSEELEELITIRMKSLHKLYQTLLRYEQ